MQALSDQQIGSLEEKIDAGFAEMRAQILSAERELRREIVSARSDARADFRTLVALVFGLWTTTALSVMAILLSQF